MQNAEHFVARWRAAGLLDASTASAIEAYESSQTKPAGRQWQVLLAVILGAILLGAGVLLFVAAHWDGVSPNVRLTLVMAMLVFFHGLGLIVQERFPGLATAMHAVGTISAGAAIALVGEIFNMQEHWPAAILVWAACAAAGWWLLRDQFQQTLTLLLVPAWIVSEFQWRVEPYHGGDVYLSRLGLVVGAAYLAAFLHSRKRAMRGILFGLGALLMPFCVVLLAESAWSSHSWQANWGFIPLTWRLTSIALTALVAGAAWLWDKRSIVPVAIAFALGMLMPWLQTTVTEDQFQTPYTHGVPSLLAYALVAAAAVALVAWGVSIDSKALVNYGIAAFALSVLWFYFSSVMDKLGRSLGLIALGALFLGGGWFLEQARRKLMHRMQGEAA